MKKSLQDAINEQIKNELASGYLYLAMSAHLAEQSLDGFAHWMRLQAQEELEHAMKLFDWVLYRGGHVELLGVDAPARELGSPLEIFEMALAHEQKVTAMIHRLFELARAESDYATELELQWFVTEQAEEEDNAGRAVEQLRLAGDSTPALLMLDQRFGSRTDEH